MFPSHDRQEARPARVEPKHSAHEIVTKHLTFYNMFLKTIKSDDNRHFHSEKKTLKVLIIN